MVSVLLYRYNDKPNVINKTLTVAETVSGLLYDKFDTMTPTLKIRYDGVFSFNYLRIEELNRYYFIEDNTILRAGVIELALRLDVLETYKKEILAATATVVNRENANPYISNREIVTDLRPQFQRVNFSVENPFDEQGSIIMVTLKGNS